MPASTKSFQTKDSSTLAHSLFDIKKRIKGDQIMIQKYIYGNPIETEAVIHDIPAAQDVPAFGRVTAANGSFRYTLPLQPEDIVYGLGEASRGINKRGFIYVSDCTDDPEHTESKRSLYGAHNFLIIDRLTGGETTAFGLFFDYPSAITFDIGYSHLDELSVFCENADLVLYMITGENASDVAGQFRKIIGKSYIPPKFSFGYGQSRWGYRTPDDFRKVAEGYRDNHLPLDMIYMDIDYMQDYKDFTVNTENFPDFKAFVTEMKEQNIRLIPIIDAGVKIEKGYDVYEEGVENGYFCKREDGSDFEACVWPGMTHFPDFLNPDARAWFGGHYKVLLDAGIEGFWNDMNEPAIFYTKEGKDALTAYLAERTKHLLSEKNSGSRILSENTGSPESSDSTENLPPSEKFESFEMCDRVQSLANNPEDYRRFYHNMNGKMVRHDKVHNLYGYNMTRAAGEAFARLVPEKKILMFSRASYIGMHRYGGIWTGDNNSWWSHILLNLQMLPSLNMCGFLYIGADLGGFGKDTTEDLLLRWLALGVFTPLMRNHSATGTRNQECYRFDHIDYFRSILRTRYRLIPYLYDTFLKAAEEDKMFFKPLGFVYPKDRIARRTEDQLMLGEEAMIAPVYTQNAIGRHVYLPEDMLFVKFTSGDRIVQEPMKKGHHFIEVALDEVPLFIRQGHRIPVYDPAEHVAALDPDTLAWLG